jgi:hypothetical protein
MIKLKKLITEKRGTCWKGYSQIGMKKKGNRMVPNCVKNEEKLSEEKIQIPGVGVMSYDGLKKNVNKKVQDLLKRSKKGNHTGVGENQFKLLGVMWKALADYEEKQ